MKRTPILRKSRPKKTNPARRKREWIRAYHSERRVVFVKGLGCAVGTDWCLNAQREPVENAHVVTGGMGRKAGYADIVPLCRSHHEALHRWGIKTFEAHYHISLKSVAAITELAWRASLGSLLGGQT